MTSHFMAVKAKKVVSDGIRTSVPQFWLPVLFSSIRNTTFQMEAMLDGNTTG